MTAVLRVGHLVWVVKLPTARTRRRLTVHRLLATLILLLATLILLLTALILLLAALMLGVHVAIFLRPI
jgi:hypothetical protein